jgi:hypothetical protein
MALGVRTFHPAIKFALDLAEAVRDEGKTVGGGHGG